MIEIKTVSQSVSSPGMYGDVIGNFNGWFREGLRHFASLSLVWISLCMWSLCGCTMLKENVPLLKKSEKSPPVQRILTMWTFSSQEEPDGSTTPGFVGKVLFFAAGSDKPISATGQIEIYVYEQQGDEWRLRRKFISEPDVWKHNERQTALGTVYDVFVPHETTKNQKYSLVLKYRGVSGQLVSSPHAQLP